MRSQPRPAITLLELVLVMAIMVMFAALSFPTIQSMYADSKLQSGSDAVRAAWAEAQAHAINEGRPYRFAILPGKGNYRVAPDSAEFWNGDGGGGEGTDSDNPPYMLENTLPKGIVFPDGNGHVPDGLVNEGDQSEEKVAAGQWVTSAIFLPDGTAQDDVDVLLQYPGCRSLTLQLRALTGTTTVQRGE
jgi:type II secretory pathway pseudopilin PulG